MEVPLAPVDAMYLEGLDLKRQQLRRLHPGLSSADLDDMVRRWIDDRPVDAPGVVRVR